MSPPGRPKGESPSAQREDSPVPAHGVSFVPIPEREARRVAQ
jgi:hypothetical protein